MKRVVVLALGSLAGWLVWTKVQDELEDRAIWAEVTDSFGVTPDQELPYTPSEG